MSETKHDLVDNAFLRMNYATQKEPPRIAYGLPYLQVNFMIMSNNKLGLGGQRLGAKVDGNKVGAALTGNRVGTGNKAGAALDGNKVGASAMDKVDLESETEAGGSQLLEDGEQGGAAAPAPAKRSKNEKSGDSSGNKLIDWKIDFDAAGGALEDRKEEVDHMESDTYEETDKRNTGTVLNHDEGIATQTDNSSKSPQSVITFHHDDYGVVWPLDTYRSFRNLGMGRLFALIAVLAIHLSLSYRTMSSMIPDPRLPIKLQKEKLL